MSSAPMKDSERGFVLVVVLWFISLLTIFAVSFSFSARGGIKLVEAEINSIRDRAYLDSGIELAAFHATITEPSNRWRADGRVYQIPIGKSILRIRIYDQSGRIDVNKADPLLLLGLLKQFVPDLKEARRINDKITSGRDTHIKRKVAGDADKGQKARSGSASGATLKYMDVSQLQYVAGMTREIYRNILPFITVHSKDGRINPLNAPRRVIMSIPSINQFDVDRFIDARRLQPMGKQLTGLLPSLAGKWITNEIGPAIKIIVGMGTSSNHDSQFMSATLLLLTGKDAPFYIMRRHIVFAPPELRETLL